MALHSETQRKDKCGDSADQNGKSDKQKETVAQRAPARGFDDRRGPGAFSASAKIFSGRGRRPALRPLRLNVSAFPFLASGFFLLCRRAGSGTRSGLLVCRRIFFGSEKQRKNRPFLFSAPCRNCRTSSLRVPSRPGRSRCRRRRTLSRGRSRSRRRNGLFSIRGNTVRRFGHDPRTLCGIFVHFPLRSDCGVEFIRARCTHGITSLSFVILIILGWV